MIKYLDIPFIMSRLSLKRPIFHSEADFQHALAWELQLILPESQVRLETPFEKDGTQSYLDLLVHESGVSHAIELKYKTRALHCVLRDEEFILKSHAAQDLGRYDFFRDLERVQHLCEKSSRTIGYSLFLTNDSSYWKSPRDPNVSYFKFSMAEGCVVQGLLCWGDSAGKGTTKGRENPILLRSQYKLKWTDFSKVSSKNYPFFRYLLAQVAFHDNAAA